MHVYICIQCHLAKVGPYRRAVVYFFFNSLFSLSCVKMAGLFASTIGSPVCHRPSLGVSRGRFTWEREKGLPRASGRPSFLSCHGWLCGPRQVPSAGMLMASTHRLLRVRTACAQGPARPATQARQLQTPAASTEGGPAPPPPDLACGLDLWQPPPSVPWRVTGGEGT